MHVFRKTLVVGILLLVVMSLFTSGAIFAVTSATFVFDFAGDVGDNLDGPQFDITAVGPMDDGGGCDEYVMIMIDPTGIVADIDPGCIPLATGTISDDGDYGSVFTPVQTPITYALFDLTAADAAALSALSQSDPAYLAYVAANATCLAEQYLDVDPGLYGPLPSGTPYSFCGGGAVVNPNVCSVPIPAGSVVGEAPLGAQVYWAPGNVSPGLVLNPGTYHVIGQDASETYYKLFFNCMYIWVRKDTMQPSYLPPQNGAPLPQRIVS
jgi:hypothetical protein